ncbi:hypothetical protein [Corynebacterium tuberculostearicum]|uniref:hypothetical protein n=1 Tax=Corynebacterium tuberculostearicum TaxID=38304 RepID=UPI00254A6234|nr:hypothetical protein [Corynebacterium tuberculostearicum]MDK8677428.1 hypothetical protein [Corynebacterium tuberculostearicum]
MPTLEQSASQSADNTNLCFAFIIAHAKTRDITETKDAVERAMQHLAQLAKAIPNTSPLSAEIGRLRAITNITRRKLARQQMPENMEVP